MRKSVVIVCILVLAAVIATAYVGIEHAVLKKTHPTPYIDTVKTYAEEYAVPEQVIYAVMHSESRFVSDAVSSAGAVGLMQLTEDTFYFLASKTGEQNPAKEKLYDPEINLRYGTFYLSRLYSEFGVWETVYAAYNAGPQTVRDWLNNPEYAENGVLKEIPYSETRAYVKKTADACEVYKALYFNETKNVTAAADAEPSK